MQLPWHSNKFHIFCKLNNIFQSTKNQKQNNNRIVKYEIMIIFLKPSHINTFLMNSSRYYILSVCFENLQPLIEMPFPVPSSFDNCHVSIFVRWLRKLQDLIARCIFILYIQYLGWIPHIIIHDGLSLGRYDCFNIVISFAFLSWNLILYIVIHSYNSSNVI